MRLHRISDSEVTECLEVPDFEEKSVENRVNCWKKFGERFLRVTVVQEGNEIVVITAVRKKSKGGGRS